MHFPGFVCNKHVKIVKTKVHSEIVQNHDYMAKQQSGLFCTITNELNELKQHYVVFFNLK